MDKRKGPVQGASPESRIEPDPDYSRRAGEATPAWLQRIQRIAAEVAADHGRTISFGDERVTRSDEDLRGRAKAMLDLAPTRDRGDFLQTVFTVRPFDLFTVDVDGEGGIWINDASVVSATGRRMAAILHEMGGSRVHDGVLDGCEPAPVMMGCCP